MKKIKKKVIVFFAKNWVIKLISLIIAVLLWFYINYEQLPAKYFSVPLKINNTPRNMSISETYNNSITVKIKGPKDTIQSLNAKYFKAEIDLKNAVIGKNTFPVNVILKKKFKRVRIVSTDPEEIRMNLDKYILKELPVSITIINSPAEGYIKMSETFSPKTVIVGGPISIIDELEAVRSVPIDIGGVTGSIFKEVELDLPSEFVTTHNYKRINVNIKIKKNYKTMYLRNIRVVPKNLKNGFKVVNKNDINVTVRIEGPPERLVILEKEKDFLFVDLKEVKEDGFYNMEVRYKIPWNCTMRKIDPREIKIDVEEKK